MRITYGDCLHVYSNVGKMDYTVRLCLKLDENIDGQLLGEALEKTSARYPYLCVRLRKNDKEFYYGENKLPVCLINTDKKISLNSNESNYHVWAICYKDDYLYFDFYHGLCDGNGMYKVLETLLYYYILQKYGKCDANGVRTLDVPFDERECADPIDSLPDLDPELLKGSAPNFESAFSVIKEGSAKESSKHYIKDVIVPEKELLKYTSANDASPGTFFTVILARAIDSVNPVRDKKIMGGYVLNARPMLGNTYSHHNCVNQIGFEYSDKMKNMPFDRQCTVMRGLTFLQSDQDIVAQKMMGMKAGTKLMMQIPTLEGKREAFYSRVHGTNDVSTFNVSYVGQWKNKDIGSHIKEFWTHVPGIKPFLLELAAVNGNVYMSLHQNFEEDIYYKAILKQLEQAGIPYQEVQSEESDIAHFMDVE
ncbi:MAG: hypothetical protein E7242_09245 [Lachnospiraceae bacterium]|nr:hypothetical protein [Lachnospiraceae bacterium]